MGPHRRRRLRWVPHVLLALYARVRAGRPRAAATVRAAAAVAARCGGAARAVSDGHGKQGDGAGAAVHPGKARWRGVRAGAVFAHILDGLWLRPDGGRQPEPLRASAWRHGASRGRGAAGRRPFARVRGRALERRVHDVPPAGRLPGPVCRGRCRVPRVERRPCYGSRGRGHRAHAALAGAVRGRRHRRPAAHLHPHVPAPAAPGRKRPPYPV